MGILNRATVLCFLGLLAAGAAEAEDWKLVKDEDGIKVYLSVVPGSRYKAYRGVAVMKTDIARLRQLQEDVVGSCAWIHECQEQRLLKSEGAQSWTYTRFNTPWPVTPRDSVLHVTSQLGADGSVTRLLEAAPDYLPKSKGFVRVNRVDGLWKLVPKGLGEVEVTYQAHTEPGGSVPSWLANSFVVDAPFNTLKAMRERAEKH